ncbi:MFS transporter-17 [Coleophoma cylindrospora]|uniref:MFS transporter-17 n=1 Tax=Coleophoma cylindrospora TaxID=1849047 RepID=A0A3D8RAB8_9HELO|nr:MFS transporter-17 [Coleophoma cylindrospora]
MDRQYPPRTTAAGRASRRLSTMEGWRDVRTGVYSAAGNGFRALSTQQQFDPERYDNEERVAATRMSKRVSNLYANGAYANGVYANYANYANNGSRYEPYESTPADVVKQMESSVAEQYPPLPPPPPPPLNPFNDAYAPKNPFGDAYAVQEKPPVAPVPVPEEPYHVFNPKQKWTLVIIIGVAGLFSGLSSNIFFPSLDAISKDLNVSLNTVSLTITSYLIIQGISPVFWGSLADTLGRRPIYIASFTVYIIANIALSFSPNFAILLIFRGIQAAGSASTVSIGNGVIQDICPPSERGAFISFYQAIRNFSIAVGPVIGGILANFFGFRSIFVFLLILSALTLIVIIIFLPETLRSIAGNGSLRLSGIHKPIIQRVQKEPAYMEDPDENYQRKKVTFMTFIEPLKLLRRKDVLFNLLFGGVVYTIWSMVTSSTTGLFKDQFKLNELLLGLCFLPNGLGTIVGSTIIGKLMTNDFKAAEVTYRQVNNLPADYKLPSKNLPANFPIEHARLRHLPWITAIFVVATAVYGFTLAIPAVVSLTGWIAVPLFLQFLIAATSNAIFALNQTLVSDLCPGKGASSTAINNLVRCGFGAVGVAFIETMISSIGSGPAFLALAFIVIAVTPLVVVNWYNGPEWRAERANTSEK